MKIQISFLSVAIIALVAAVLPVGAQYRTDVFAITNARVVTVSGATLEKATVIIRDGLIEAVGESTAVPADARVIDGSGLTVYPGFFDAATSLGIPARTVQRGSESAPAQNQPVVSVSNYPDGMRPEEAAFNGLKSGEAQFEAHRNTGITTALSVGSDGIFKGQSALINLAGDSVSAMIIRAPVAQHISFTTLRGGVYPASLLGTFSALRQMFLDSTRFQQLQKMYSANPRGMKRPEADPSLEALIPVVSGQIPVVFNANSEREINRALDLAREFKLKVIVAGGFEAWKVADRLKAQDVPVILSLNFPVRTAAASKDEDPENLDTLRLRVEVPKNAARLRQAGVRFAFESGETKNIGKDFLGNLVIATENGLSKDDAIRALTLGAAEILGVSDRLGSIETGKIANLVVSRGDILAGERTITHVFVDGKLFEQKEKPKTPARPAGNGAGSAPQVGGTYRISIEAPGMSVPGTLVLVQQSDVLNGSLETQFGTSQIQDGKVTAAGFSFATTVEVAGQSMGVLFNGTKSGERIEGTIATPQGVATFSGTKTP